MSMTDLGVASFGLGLLSLLVVLWMIHRGWVSRRGAHRVAVLLIGGIGLTAGLLLPRGAYHYPPPLCQPPPVRAVLGLWEDRFASVVDFAFEIEVVRLDRGPLFAYADEPGRRVMLSTGMLAWERLTPEVMSGVLAHELAHLAWSARGRQEYWPPWEASRREELAADRWAMEMLARKGWGNQGVVGFLEQARQLRGNTPYQLSGLRLPASWEQRLGEGLQYFATHPSADRRLARTRPRVQAGSSPIQPEELAVLRETCLPAPSR